MHVDDAFSGNFQFSSPLSWSGCPTVKTTNAASIIMSLPILNFCRLSRYYSVMAEGLLKGLGTAEGEFQNCTREWWWKLPAILTLYIVHIVHYVYFYMYIYNIYMWYTHGFYMTGKLPMKRHLFALYLCSSRPFIFCSWMSIASNFSPELRNSFIFEVTKWIPGPVTITGLQRHITKCMNLWKLNNMIFIFHWAQKSCNTYSASVLIIFYSLLGKASFLWKNIMSRLLLSRSIQGCNTVEKLHFG